MKIENLQFMMKKWFQHVNSHFYFLILLVFKNKLSLKEKLFLRNEFQTKFYFNYDIKTMQVMLKKLHFFSRF